MDNYRRNAILRGTQQVRQAAPVLTALVLGGLVGAGAMMLFAPKSGKETRANIQHKAHELRERTVDSAKDAMKQVTSRTHELSDGLKGRADHFQNNSREALAEQLGHIEHAAKAARKMVQP